MSPCVAATEEGHSSSCSASKRAGSAQRESAINDCKIVDLPESLGPTKTVIGPSGIVAEAIALK
jgi:hypothetical protein